MDNFIKKIFDKKESDEFMHLQFQRFSKGIFKNRALIKASCTASNKYKIQTTFEFANEIVRFCAEDLGDEKTNIRGIVVSTRDLTGELEFKTKKQYMGVKQYGIDGYMSGKEIIELLNKYPAAFFAFSFKSKNMEIKIKAKPPKSKPSTKGDGDIKADFCTITTNNKEIARNFIFESDNFKKVEIIHTFIIEDIILPKTEEDIAKIRELAKRKGKIIRNSNIDGIQKESQIEFLA